MCPVDTGISPGTSRNWTRFMRTSIIPPADAHIHVLEIESLMRVDPSRLNGNLVPRIMGDWQNSLRDRIHKIIQ